MNKKVQNCLLSTLIVIKLIFTDLFLIINGAENYPGPRTGDNAPTMVIFIIMGGAVAVMIPVLIMYLKNKKK